jgi:hypothetical protein
MMSVNSPIGCPSGAAKNGLSVPLIYGRLLSHWGKLSCIFCCSDKLSLFPVSLLLKITIATMLTMETIKGDLVKKWICLLQHIFERIQRHRASVGKWETQVSLIPSLLSHCLIFYCRFSYLSVTGELIIEMPTGIPGSCAEWIIDWFSEVSKSGAMEIETTVEGFTGEHFGRYSVCYFMWSNI